MLTQCPKYLFDIIPSSESVYDTRKKQRPFSISELNVSNILSFQMLDLNGRDLPQKFKTQSLLQFSKANFSLLLELAKDLYSISMTLKMRRLKAMNIFSCAASILKMIEGPSSSTYHALVHLLKICPVIWKSNCFFLVIQNVLLSIITLF